MVLKYAHIPDAMEDSAGAHTSIATLDLPLRPLEPAHSRSSIISTSTEWRHEPKIHRATDLYMRSPTTSACSQDSFAETEYTMSSAPSSPPRSPKKREQSESQLYSIPARPPFLRPDTLPPMVRRPSTEDTLPSLGSLLAQVRLSSSSDVTVTGDYITAHRPIDTPEPSLITNILDQSRQQQRLSQHRRDRTRLSPLRAVHLPPSAPKSQLQGGYPPLMQLRTAGLDEPCAIRSSDALRHTRDGGIRSKSSHLGVATVYATPGRKRTDIPHNNSRYSVEGLHFIRYLKTDCGLGWPEIEDSFKRAFPPLETKERHTQGVQGVLYRQNRYLPKLDLETNTILYLPNGHIRLFEVQCRKQKVHEAARKHHIENKIYGIINLWPEAAMTYTWVSDSDKIKAAKLVDRRRKEREDAQRAAHESGQWMETVPPNSCACCVDLKREERNGS